MPVETAGCPECCACAEVVRREWLASTDGPVEHLVVHCVRRHIFFLPAASVPGCGPGTTAKDHATGTLPALGRNGGVRP